MDWKLWQKVPRITGRSLSDKSKRGFKFRKKRAYRPDIEKIPELNKALIIFPAGLAAVMFLFAFVVSSEGMGLWLGLFGGGASVLLAFAAWRVRYRPLRGDDGWQGAMERKLQAIESDDSRLSKKEQAVQKEASEKAVKAGLSIMAKRKRQKLYKRVRDELLENGVSMIGAEDDLATQEQREEFFEELVFEFSTMESKSITQEEEYTPAPKNRRLRGEDEIYFGRIIMVIGDGGSAGADEDETE